MTLVLDVPGTNLLGTTTERIKPGDIVRRIRRKWNGTTDERVVQKRLWVVVIQRGNAKGTQSLWLLPLDGVPTVTSPGMPVTTPVAVTSEVAVVVGEALRFRGKHAPALQAVFRRLQQEQVNMYGERDCSAWVYLGDIGIMEEP